MFRNIKSPWSLEKPHYVPVNKPDFLVVYAYILVFSALYCKESKTPFSIGENLYILSERLHSAAVYIDFALIMDMKHSFIALNYEAILKRNS